MILWLGIGFGLMTGLGLSRWQGHPYPSPIFKHSWLLFLGFVPQIFVIYLGNNRVTPPDWLAASVIITSQLFLFAFAWLNRHLPGMYILIFGLILNLAVIVVNGGFMPISPQTAARLVGDEYVRGLIPGDRFGFKDILINTPETRLEILADRFLPPAGFPYQVAFSLGDIFIAFGAFWILAHPKTNS